MGFCVVKGCSNNSNKKNNTAKVSFHSFPKDPMLAALWIEKLRLNRREECWKPTIFTKICSIHFDDKVKYTTKRGFIKLREGLHLDCLEECQPRNQGLHDPHELDKPPLVSQKDTDLESMEKISLRRQIKMKNALLHKHKNKVRALQQIIQRLMKNNVCLQNILKELKSRFIDTD